MASRAAEYIGEGRPEFLAWMERVDAICSRRTGLSIFDLPDQCFCDWFEDGVSPKEAVQTTLEEEGFV